MTEVQMSCHFAESTSDNMQRTKFKTQLVLNQTHSNDFATSAYILSNQTTQTVLQQSLLQPGEGESTAGSDENSDEFPPGAFTASGVKDFQQQISGRTP